MVGLLLRTMGGRSQLSCSEPRRRLSSQAALTSFLAHSSSSCSMRYMGGTT